MIHKFSNIYLNINLVKQQYLRYLITFRREINEQIFRSATHADFYSVFNIM